LADILSVQEARERILSILQPVETEWVSIDNCAGRILAGEISASADLPGFANSSMDGFAVISADTSGASWTAPANLNVIEDIPAGKTPVHEIEAGQAARIMTGAMLPLGADAVIPVEDTNISSLMPPGQADSGLPASVAIYRPARPGAYIRTPGQDVRKGQALLPKNRRLLPQDIGILAMTGHGQVQVFRKPRVALFSSGDELVQPGQPLMPGKIYDSNQYALAAMLAQGGAEILHLGNSPDDPGRIQSLLDRGIEQKADLIVTSAGVSVGAFDFVRQVIEANGKLDFWKVNMRPGKPLAFGLYRGVPLIGLPGNPVSAFIGCHLFAVPAVAKLAGRAQLLPKRMKAILSEPIESDGRESYLRAVVEGDNCRLVARLTGHQGSGNLYSLVQANALLIVPSGVKSLPSDSEVDFWFLDGE
jgi:molybdopterin molybdotransferase